MLTRWRLDLEILEGLVHHFGLIYLLRKVLAVVHAQAAILRLLLILQVPMIDQIDDLFILTLRLPAKQLLDSGMLSILDARAGDRRAYVR